MEHRVGGSRSRARVNPGKIIFFLLRPVFGFIGLWLFNILMSFTGVSLGLNALNAIVLGYLGLPGLVTLLLVKVLFGA